MSGPEITPEEKGLLPICLASTMKWWTFHHHSQIQQDNWHHLFMSTAGTTFQTLYEPGAMVSVMSEASYLSIPAHCRLKSLNLSSPMIVAMDLTNKTGISMDAVAVWYSEVQLQSVVKIIKNSRLADAQ